MRTVGSNGDATQRALRCAAIDAIAKNGFGATSLRDLAKEVGIQAGSLYNYITTKEDFLFELIRGNLEGMISEFERRSTGLTDPKRRLEEFIDLHLEFHTTSQKEVFIGNMELRSLTPRHYKIITDLRDRYSNMLTQILKDGAKQGVFEVSEPRITTFTILSMLTGICSWYRPDGRLSQQKLKRLHVEMTFRSLGVDCHEDAKDAKRKKVS